MLYSENHFHTLPWEDLTIESFGKTWTLIKDRDGTYSILIYNQMESTTKVAQVDTWVIPTVLGYLLNYKFRHGYKSAVDEYCRIKDLREKWEEGVVNEDIY